jgi:hypothetical protein
MPAAVEQPATPRANEATMAQIKTADEKSIPMIATAAKASNIAHPSTGFSM